MMAAAPYGALPQDTAEYMLGDVLVTVVLMESNTNVSQINPNTENWTSAAIAAVKQKVQDGVRWWEQTLATQYPNATQPLNFQFDFTYADSPALTDYEPISQISNYFQYWMYDFLEVAGVPSTGNFSNDIRTFNNAQRTKFGTDWAYTIFVVNDQNDADGLFAYGGSFRRAFSFAGGQMIVSPAGRPASTFAHESGHMFWARDEYAGGGSYTDRRGYYNTQNLNAWDNPTPGFVQADSVMAVGTLLEDAYAAHTSSDFSLEMIGWRDADGDGVLDVLDVPLRLTGTGYPDPQAGVYRFVGTSSVQTLPNLNSSGLQNDITLNKVRRAEYRIDGGAWQTAAVFDAYSVSLDLQFPLPTGGPHTVDIRTLDTVSGVTSAVFQGDTFGPASVLQAGLNGFVWHDANEDGDFNPGERGLADWAVQLVDGNGNPLDLVEVIEPDDYPSGTSLATVHPQATLTAVGGASSSITALQVGTGKVFANGSTSLWTPGGAQMRVNFASPVTSVRLDATGAVGGDYARLEAYDQSNRLLARDTTRALGSGETLTLQLSRPVAEIAYVIAKAHSGNGVRFDKLQFGPESTVTTDTLGAYSIASLSSGTYYVQAASPSGDPALTPRQTVVLAEGEAAGDVNFVGAAGITSWQNATLPYDVNGDGYVAPIDALVLINYINAHPGDTSLPSTPAVPPPYYDVDGNGYVTATDVLLVVNVLNGTTQLNASSSTAGEGSNLAISATSIGEGEPSFVGHAARVPRQPNAPAPQPRLTHVPPASPPAASDATTRPHRSRRTLLSLSQGDELAVSWDRVAGFDDVLNAISLDVLVAWQQAAHA